MHADSYANSSKRCYKIDMLKIVFSAVLVKTLHLYFIHVKLPFHIFIIVIDNDVFDTVLFEVPTIHMFQPHLKDSCCYSTVILYIALDNTLTLEPIIVDTSSLILQRP